MTSTELLSQLDWHQVGAVMRRPELLDVDLEEAGRRVAEVVGYYLPLDILGLSSKGTVDIEHRVSYQPFKTARTRTGVIDLSIMDCNSRVIVDWKLVQHADWRPIDQERQEWDLAWAFYCRYGFEDTPDTFIYRNIMFRPKPKGPAVVEVRLVPTAATYNWLHRELQYTELLLDLYEGNPQIPWPQHAPSACTAFGARCPYYEDCKSAQVPFVEIKQTISPSRMKELKLCPERARRNSVIREGEGYEGFGGDKPELGSAFHRGIAEVYRQGWEIVRRNEVD